MSDSHPNNRSTPRISLKLKVQVRWKDHIQEYTTRDISDNGVFLLYGPEPYPPVGEKISIKVLNNVAGEEPPWVDGEIMRVDNDGIGVRFQVS